MTYSKHEAVIYFTHWGELYFFFVVVLNQHFFFFLAIHINQFNPANNITAFTIGRKFIKNEKRIG